MYHELKLIIQQLTENDIIGDEGIFESFMNFIDKYDNNIFPATNLYEIITGQNWGIKRNLAKHWRKKIVSIISMCKLNEGIMKLKFPGLIKKNKNHIHDIYSKLVYILEYSKRIRKYLATEVDFVNVKSTPEYRRLGKLLVLEKYVFK